VIDLTRGVLASVSHTEEGPDMVRVLVTVEPRMYRGAIALGVQRLRPDSKVKVVPENVLDGQVKDFRPHVLVRNDSDGAIPEGLLDRLVCRVEMLYTDGMAARIGMDGRSYTIEDASLDDLLSLLDETEKLASGQLPSG
jgi:hypothetical protein